MGARSSFRESSAIRAPNGDLAKRSHARSATVGLGFLRPLEVTHCDRPGLLLDSRMLVRRMLEALPRLRCIFWVSFVFSLVIELLKLAPPFLLKSAIDALILPESSFLWLMVILGAVLVASMVVTLVEERYMTYTVRTAFDIEVDLLQRLHAKLMSLGMRFHEDHPSGELEHTVKQGARQFRELVWFFQERFIGALIQIALTCGVLLMIDVGSGLIYVAFMPAVVWLVHRNSARLQPFRRRYHEAFRHASWTLSQSLRNIRTVKDFVQEDTEISTYQGQLRTYQHLAADRQKFERSGARRTDVLLNVARVSLLAYAVYRVHQGAISPGTLVLFMTLSEKVVASLFRLGRLYDYLGDARLAVLQMLDLFTHEPDFVDTTESKPVDKLEGVIDFCSVSFAYQSEGRRALSNIDLHVPARTTVALVGRSGAGKTTIVKLLLRHYDVSEGALKVDGVDIRDYRVHDYRQNIAVVSQDVEVFDRTVRDNIIYGRPDVDQADVLQAARSAYAHEFIERLPQGYDTRVGERGFKLSGGQRQRIGIARALLAKPSILIFDEATSSLDTESEQLIQRALAELGQSHTLVIVAHRLSTIRNADWVAVLDDGRIVESDTHDALMNQRGVFQYMQTLQSEGALRA